MTLLFVDTAGWMAMADQKDPLHREFRRLRDAHLRRGGLLVTSDYVMDETLTLIRIGSAWTHVADFGSRLPGV